MRFCTVTGVGLVRSFWHIRAIIPLFGSLINISLHFHQEYILNILLIHKKRSFIHTLIDTVANCGQVEPQLVMVVWVKIHNTYWVVENFLIH
jgi:hypothetical protein